MTLASSAIQESCAQWMASFIKDFEADRVRTYTLDRLYKYDVAPRDAELAALQNVCKTSWDASGILWQGKLPEGWSNHSGSWRTFNVESPQFPGFIFKFCKGAPGRGVPAAHFLRVPKGKEIREIMKDEGFDEFELVEERLIALKPQEEIQKMSEGEQCCYFVVASRKLNLMNEFQTAETLASLPQQKQEAIASQIMRMICRTGLGDCAFHNININKETGKPVLVDTEPFGGSLLLDVDPKFSHQYPYTQSLVKSSKNSDTVLTGLESMIASSRQYRLPIFQEVAEIYKRHFIQALPSKK